MAITVNSNVSALTAQRNLNKSSSALATSMERLSSGSRINSAKDDAAGLQISNRLNSQIKGLGVAMKNASDGISMAQTAEGAMQESTNILQRMRDLALQSANGSNSDEDRASIQKEIGQLQSELTRIADSTSFGGQKLLNGAFGTKSFQIGANANESQSLGLSDISSSAIGRKYQSFDKTADLTTKVAGGTESGAGQVLVKVGDKTHEIALNAGMSASDVQEKINSISGLSDVKVTGGEGPESTPATMKLSNLAVANGESLDLTIGGEKITLNGTGDAAGDAATFKSQIEQAAGKAGYSVTEKDGTFSFTGKDDGSQIAIKLEAANTTTSDTKVNINGKSYAGNGTTAINATQTSTNGINAEPIRATMELSGLTVANGDSLKLKIGDADVITLTGTNSANDAKAFKAQIMDAAEKAGYTVTEDNGTYTFTGKEDGSQINIEVGGAGNSTTASTDVTINGVAYDGLANISTTAKKQTSTNGVAAAVDTPATMTLKGFDAVNSGTMKLTIDGIDVTVDKNVSDTEKLADLINSTLSAAGSEITATLNDDKTEITLTGGQNGEQFAVKADVSGATGSVLQAGDRIYSNASLKTSGNITTAAGGAGVNSTVTIDNFAAVTSGVMSMTVDGAIFDVDSSITTAAELADKINAEAGTTVTASESDGVITITHNTANTALTVAADASGAAGAQVEITGDTSALVAGTAVETETTNGIAVEKDGFTIDFSNAKLDDGIASVSVGATVNDLESSDSAMALAEGTTFKSVASIDLSTTEGANEAVEILDKALASIDDQRASLGAFQNRMNSTINNLASIQENAAAGMSRIMDVDFAQETVNLTKQQILQQAGTSILAQAKQLPQAALSLLG
ncbi:hypothetical protein C7I36_06795 [Zobellella taiwanensis]|uniref:Flagellin n=2 Tax=Zobellella taiwanensis TaxID=347535 RepID=A0A2P7R331_9GAMM|nr:hypothetical protein C7I36_06795 [Zobellella taiwanensis]